MKRLVWGFLLALMAWGARAPGAESIETTAAQAPLQLPGLNAESVTLAVNGEARLAVLCFLGTECPLARLYGPRLAELSQTYAGRVQFIGIHSNQQDSLEDVRKYAVEYGLSFPQVKDYDQTAADRFQIQRTPEVCVIDAGGEVRYRGRVDDQYLPGVGRPAPARNDLAIALDELLAGRPVSVAKTTSVGCLVGRRPKVTTPTDLTYCRDVAPVLQRNCVECHRSGDIGPFALTEYDEVTGWGEMLLEVMADGRMPPWHATEASGPFVNAREMPEADKATLRAWVAGGMPFGDVHELPPPPAPRATWDLGREPDHVVAMRDEPFSIPAEGTIDYQYFVADPGFTEDRWVTGAEVLPGNRSVVHHCIVFIRPPDGTELPGLGWLTAYVPGQRTLAMPAGMGRRVPAGSRLVFQMHYTPNGSAQTDTTRLGLLFADEATIDQEVYTLMAINQDFEIPPGATDFAVEARLDHLPREGVLLAMAPHMHVRGKACRVTARSGNQLQPLLEVPRYDFNWQHVYALEQAIPLNSLEGIEFTAHFDNSVANPVNPDPTQYVHWGDQTWEEMAVAFFEVARPRTPPTAATRTSKPDAEPAITDEDRRFVEDFFQRHDTNRDGIVDESEVPSSVKEFGFRRLDADRSRSLSREEVTELIRRDERF